MNVLFLSLEAFRSINESNMYADILRQFTKNGHMVYAISPIERRYHGKTNLVCEENSILLLLRIGNIQKTSLFEKGISTLAIEQQYINAIKKYFAGVKFDLVLYATPPITFCRVIEYVKKRDGAFNYLMLKDIFPQNAVDLGMMKTRGPMEPIYQFFRSKERKLYAVSDRIGCMSQANVNYVLAHNPEVNSRKVGICPNCIEIVDNSVDTETRKNIRRKYGIPEDRIVFVYGGNLGRPQGIPFLVECMKTQKENNQAFFLIVGDGTEYPVLEQYSLTEKQDNFKLMQRLPKEDYDTLVGACDVGMLFLDHRFTIPNFPSRLLSYMQAKLPVLACTDPNTDVGKVIVEGGFGWWCESNSAEQFDSAIQEIMKSDLSKMGEDSMEYLRKNYAVEIGYQKIIDDLKTFRK